MANCQGFFASRLRCWRNAASEGGNLTRLASRPVASFTRSMMGGCTRLLIIKPSYKPWRAWNSNIFVGDGRRFLPIHEPCSSLSQITCRVLPGAHTLSGCNTTSSFFGNGKELVYKILKVWNEARRICWRSAASEGGNLTRLASRPVASFTRSMMGGLCSCKGKSQCKKSCVCAEQNLACTDLCSYQGSESCKNVHSYTLAEDV
jgi:hypothetical protein